MAEETTTQFLYRRHRELLAQISALKGQLEPKEAELMQIAQTLKMLGLLEPPPNPTNYTDAFRPFLAAGNYLEQHAASDQMMRENLAKLDEIKVGYAQYLKMTIKELVIQALLDHFPEGATITLIREFIREGYGRAIEQSSLRPQMHRLKADGVLIFRPENETWNLDQRKRGLYAMYNHPTSRAAMKELQDDEISDQEAEEAPKKSPNKGLEKLKEMMEKKKKTDGFLE